MRLSFKELNKIKKEHGIDILWSFSRFNNYRTSHYEYFLKYLLKEKPRNQKDSAYAPIGGEVHDILEKYYNGEIKYEEMVDEFENTWAININTLGFVFDKTDPEKNKNIQNKYYKNLQHFFKNFQPIDSKVIREQFLLIKITDDIFFQGYADEIYKDKDGFYNIIDDKTSTVYTGKAIEEHAAQLILYAEGLHQKGIPLDKIKCAWHFIKYVNVDIEQINGKIKTSSLERCTLAEKLQSKVKVWLKKLGYENQSNELLEKMIETNSLDCLPEDVKSKFTIRDCYIYIDDIPEKYEKLREEIINTIAEINEKTEEYYSTYSDKCFWDDEETCKKESYYFNNLCEFSIEQLKPYKQYLEKLEREKTDPLGMASVLNKNVEAKEETKEEDDMSWLDDLI